MTEENLRTYYAWTIQHYLGEKPENSYRTIGDKYDSDHTFVEDKIDFVVKYLDPDLQEPRLKNQVSLILDAVKKEKRVKKAGSFNHL